MKLPSYELHFKPELIWGVAFTVLTFIGQAAQEASIETVVEDPWAWIFSVVVGVGRIVVGAILPGSNSLK